MARRAFSIALAATAALLYSTNAAAAPSLSLAAARSLATGLAQLQFHTRHILEYELGRPRRAGSERVVFPYYDRPRHNSYCTAALVVTLREPAGLIADARFARQRCRPIHADALAFESATLAAVARMRAKRAAVDAAFAGALRSSRRCGHVRVPRRAQADATAIFAVAVTEAIERPVLPALRAFVRTISSIPTSDGTLIDGGSGWFDELDTVRSLPRIRDACAALWAWAARRFARPAPVGFDTLVAIGSRGTADDSAIAAAAATLRRDGISPRVAAAFTAEGLAAEAFQDLSRVNAARSVVP